MFHQDIHYIFSHLDQAYKSIDQFLQYNQLNYNKFQMCHSYIEHIQPNCLSSNSSEHIYYTYFQLHLVSIYNSHRLSYNYFLSYQLCHIYNSYTLKIKIGWIQCGFKMILMSSYVGNCVLLHFHRNQSYNFHNWSLQFERDNSYTLPYWNHSYLNYLNQYSHCIGKIDKILLFQLDFQSTFQRKFGNVSLNNQVNSHISHCLWVDSMNSL